MEPIVQSEIQHAKKYVFYIYAPAYTPLSSGVRVLYILCSLLNRMGYESFITGSYVGIEFSAPTLTSEIVKKHKEMGLSQVAIYPEIIMGNPLQSKYVIRWLLNKPNNFLQNWLGDFSEDEFIVHHDESFVPMWINSNKQFIPHIDRSIFNTKFTEIERKGLIIYEHRNKIPKELMNSFSDIQYISSKKPLTPLECSLLYKKSQMLIVAERTAAHAEAALCGCPTLFIENDKFNAKYVFDTYWKISSYKEFNSKINNLNYGNGEKLEKLYDNEVEEENLKLRILILKSIQFFEKIKEKLPVEMASILLENCDNLVKVRNYKDALVVLERLFQLPQIPNRAYFLYYKIAQDLNNSSEAEFAQNYLYKKIVSYGDRSIFEKIFNFDDNGKFLVKPN